MFLGLKMKMAGSHPLCIMRKKTSIHCPLWGKKWTKTILYLVICTECWSCTRNKGWDGYGDALPASWCNCWWWDGASPGKISRDRELGQKKKLKWFELSDKKDFGKIFSAWFNWMNFYGCYSFVWIMMARSTSRLDDYRNQALVREAFQVWFVIS